jgi:hypothetical protein
MKKFTRIFLLGEHNFARFLRKIGLSLVVLLWTFAAFAQEYQSTYEVWAKDATYCYQGDNMYEVNVTMKDFIKIHEFSLKLSFNNTLFSFLGAEAVHPQLQDGWVTPTVSSGNVINLNWVTNGDVVTIEESDDLDGGLQVFTLKFAINGTPYYYTGATINDFVSSLNWTGSSYRNLPAQEPIENFWKRNGTLTVDQKWKQVDVTSAIASCDGGSVLATVVSDPPYAAGMQYNFNGVYQWHQTWLGNPTSEVTAPSLNSVEFRDASDASGCVSFIKPFEVKAEAPLSFKVTDPTFVPCPNGNGNIQIEADGGRPPYTYYLVPETQWNAGDNVFGNLTQVGGNLAIINKYKLDNTNQAERPKGMYYAAVQDANGCAVISGTNLMDWWKTVEVIDNNDPFDIKSSFRHPHCVGKNGMIDIMISGGSPFKIGQGEGETDAYDLFVYKNGDLIAPANQWPKRTNSWTSSTTTAGTYTFAARDANGCWFNPAPIVLSDPKPVDFTVDWTDTGCEGNFGELWIDEVLNPAVVYADYNYLVWQYTTDPNNYPMPGVNEFAIDEKATGLAAGIYYVRVLAYQGQQGLDPCAFTWTNDQGDNAVKILDTKFNIAVTQPKCFGDMATVTITLASGSASNQFNVYMETGENGDDNGSQYPTSVTTPNPFGPWVFMVGPFEPGTSNTIKFFAEDLKVNCTYELSAIVNQPTPVEAYIIPLLTVPPTCSDASDGNLAIQVSGGTPLAGNQYWVKVDGGNWLKSNAYFTYGLDNKMHTIRIKDANDCETELWFDLPDFKNKISFVDDIWLTCPAERINLFNGYPETCDETVFGTCISGIDMDLAYFNVWESQWHGIPIEHFLGNAWNPSYIGLVASYLNSLGFTDFDVDEIIETIEKWGSLGDLEGLLAELDIETTFDISDITEDNLLETLSRLNILYRYWTSDKGWKTVVTQGVEILRNPMLYWREAGNTAWNTLTHTTSFGPGKYEIQAWDEFGCKSNIETVNVRLSQGPIVISATTAPAGCFGDIDGEINISVTREVYRPFYTMVDLAIPIPGTYQVPGSPLNDPFIQYSIIAQGSEAIFNKANWWLELTWLPMEGYSHSHISAQGSYWIVVRDYCAVVENSAATYLANRKFVTVEGKDKLLITTPTVASRTTCYGDNNGTITTGVVTGGYGGYSYTLTWLDGNLHSSYPRTNNTGVFSGLYSGLYLITVVDAEGCSTVSQTVTLTQPDQLLLDAGTYFNASCNGVFDGFIRYKISGGTPPYREITNNLDMNQKLNPSAIPDNSPLWYAIDLTSENVINVNGQHVFDRRLRAGTYEIIIRDANGCQFVLKDPVVIKEPQPISATWSAPNVYCLNNNTTGNIRVYPKGGWNLAGDGNTYYVTLKRGTVTVGNWNGDILPAHIDFPVSLNGTYTLEIREYNPSMTYKGDVANRPWTTYSDYFTPANWSQYTIYQPYQNPSASYSCPVYTASIEVGQNDGITAEVDYFRVQCFNTATGKITITNVKGGTGPYYFTLEGPEGSNTPDYDFETDVWSSAGVPNTAKKWYPETTDGATSYTFTGLARGFYNVYIKDANGCIVYPESGEINNMPELTLNMRLTDNANCNTGLGKFVMEAAGGTGKYEYAVLDATFFFPAYKPTEWQASPEFEKPAGVWIGWVRDVANNDNPGGCITGGATTTTGDVIQAHRVRILESTPVLVGNVWSGFDDRASCYGYSNGRIRGVNLSGGVGSPYTAVVETYPYGEEDQKYYFTDLSAASFTLGGLPASTNKPWGASNLVQADKYKVTFYDRTYGTNDQACKSAPVYVSVHQPEEFVIDWKTTQDVFVCHNDLAGVFEIVVVQGGTPFDGVAGRYQYRWEARDKKIEDGGQVIYSGDWSFTPTLIGYGGFHYYAWARDVNGCTTDAAYEFVDAPAKVVINEIKDLSCFGDLSATARVSVSGQAGRTFQVRYLRFAGQTEWPWSEWSQPFEGSLTSIIF